MYSIVVRRGDFQTFDLLHTAFGQRTNVIWERRHGDRRHHTAPVDFDDRRRRDRRVGPCPSWSALGFVVVKD